MKRTFNEKQQKILAFVGVAVFVLITVFFCVFVGKPLIRSLSEPEKFKEWLDGFGFFGRLCYMGMVTAQVFFAVIPGEPFEIFGGYAFGAVEGTLLNLAAAWIGSCIVFFFVRRFGVRAVEIFFSKEKIESLKFLHSSPKREAIFYFLYTVPGTPKDLLCYFAGLTDINSRNWLIFSLIGRLPSIVTSSFGGDALSSENYPKAVAIFAITLVLSALGAYVYCRICTAKSRKNAEGVKHAEAVNDKKDK